MSAVPNSRRAEFCGRCGTELLPEETGYLCDVCEYESTEADAEWIAAWGEAHGEYLPE